MVPLVIWPPSWHCPGLPELPIDDICTVLKKPPQETLAKVPHPVSLFQSEQKKCLGRILFQALKETEPQDRPRHVGKERVQQQKYMKKMVEEDV